MGSFFTEGLDKAKKMPGSSSIKPNLATRLYLPIGKGTKIVLLDDGGVNIYEHSIFIRGDKTAMKLKVTCKSPGPDPVPNKCRICNAMIKDDRIARKYVSYLSCVDLSKFEIDGTTYTHVRKLVPLNKQAAKKFERRKKERGTLVGAVLKLFRNEKTSPVIGDEVEYIKRVNLPKMFMKSPRIQGLIDFYAKRGESITEKEALKILITPFDYSKELEPTEKRVDYFLAYIAGDNPKPPVEEEENTDYDYSDDSVTAADDEEEDFTDFEDDDEEPPKPKKKKKAKKKKKKKKVIM